MCLDTCCSHFWLLQVWTSILGMNSNWLHAGPGTWIRITHVKGKAAGHCTNGTSKSSSILRFSLKDDKARYVTPGRHVCTQPACFLHISKISHCIACELTLPLLTPRWDQLSSWVSLWWDDDAQLRGGQERRQPVCQHFCLKE